MWEKKIMAEFTPITTQEQLDKVIGDRLKREKESTIKKLQEDGWMSKDDAAKAKAGYEKQIADMSAAADEQAKKYAKYDKELADRDAKIKSYETASVKARVAHEAGLSYDAIQFLKGDDEESIKTSAESLKTLMGSVKPDPAPLADPDKQGGDRADFKSLLHNLRGE